MFILLTIQYITNDYSQEFIDDIIESGENIVPYMETEKMLFNINNIVTINPDKNTNGSVITMINGNEHSVSMSIEELHNVLSKMSVLHLNN